MRLWSTAVAVLWATTAFGRLVACRKALAMEMAGRDTDGAVGLSRPAAKRIFANVAAAIRAAERLAMSAADCRSQCL